MKSTVIFCVLLALCATSYFGGTSFAKEIVPKNETNPADVSALLNITFEWKENTKILQQIWNITDDSKHSDPCFPTTWRGLDCVLNNDTGYLDIHELRLSEKELTGTITNSLLLLTNLNTLVLTENNLTGDISRYNFTNWINLNTLNLANNQFYGTLPTFPTTIQYLQLNHNDFIGPVPDEWFNGNVFSVLTDLDISHNQLVKQLPQPVASKLEFINIADNNFYGVVPAINSTNMPNATILYFNSNSLSSGHGNISNLPMLTNILLSGNPVKTLSEFEFDTFPKLYQFECDNCKLLGDLPATLPNTTAKFSVQNNQLSGQLPATWGGNNLKWILLNDNQLTGPIPESWGGLAARGVKTIDVDNNQLSGSLPSWLMNSPDTYTFSSKCNNFGGSLPNWCKNTLDCVSCAKPGGGDGGNGHAAYLWFLLIPGCMLFCLLGAVIGYFVYRKRLRSGYENVGDAI